jgi:hypothetical protein
MAKIGRASKIIFLAEVAAKSKIDFSGKLQDLT